MPALLYPSLFSHYATETAVPGTWMLRRGQLCSTVVFVDAGRVALGIAGDKPGAGLVQRLGVVQGPQWLDATSPVLDLPSNVDAWADTEVTFRQIPLDVFRAALNTNPQALRWVLVDIALAHRQQTDVTVSRLAKDAEARCAEWLLAQANSFDNNVCAVRLQQRKHLIAAQLGIAPETLSRVLRHLRERKLISGSGRVLNLVDMQGLRQLAGV